MQSVSGRTAQAGSRAFTHSTAAPRLAVRMASNYVARTPAPGGIIYDLDPDNASFLVCGGGGVALHVTRKLKNMGSWVWQLQRTDVRRKEIESMMAIVSKGDALNKADLQKVFDDIEEVDAVISTVGGTTKDPRADGEGNINIIEAAVKKGVKKFILVTSVGAGNSKDAPGEQVYKVLEPVLVEKTKAEEVLMSYKDKMACVIIRPGGLVSEPGTKGGVLTEDASVCGAITREDVADLVIKALLSKKADGKILTAVDKSRVTTKGAYTEFAL